MRQTLIRNVMRLCYKLVNSYNTYAYVQGPAPRDLMRYQHHEVLGVGDLIRYQHRRPTWPLRRVARVDARVSWPMWRRSVTVAANSVRAMAPAAKMPANLRRMTISHDDERTRIGRDT